MKQESLLKSQIVPLLLTLVTFLLVSVCLYLFLFLLNLLPIKEKIILHLRLGDILVGLTIYLKTAIDFAIFIGNLMSSNRTWKARIAIEVGTALGNALGTLLILGVWNFFREVPLLMVLMIIIAALVLLRMAEDSFDDLARRYNNRLLIQLLTVLKSLNKLFSPLLRRLLPESKLMKPQKLSFTTLLIFSATIPFILGLDDFAGYIPLFSIVNVFGFSIGVFLGHMLLNAALFISPEKTTKLVHHTAVLLIGGLAFIGIAGWGFYEAFHLLLATFH